MREADKDALRSVGGLIYEVNRKDQNTKQMAELLVDVIDDFAKSETVPEALLNIEETVRAWTKGKA